MTAADWSRPEWIKTLLCDSQSYWKRITHSALFSDIAAGKLSVERLRFALTNFYPVIENFPMYLGLMLSKAPAGNAGNAVLARQWLMENLHVEQRHANWFVDFAVGFGVPRSYFRK